MKLLRLQLRLIIGGSVLCVLGVVLFVVRGNTTAFLVLPIVGVILIAVGLLWKGSKGATPSGDENKPGVW